MPKAVQVDIRYLHSVACKNEQQQQVGFANMPRQGELVYVMGGHWQVRHIVHFNGGAGDYPVLHLSQVTNDALDEMAGFL